MTTNDLMLEVLRGMRGDITLIATEMGRLGRLLEYTNARLDEHGGLLREHGRRLESLERGSAATVASLELLRVGVGAIVPAIEQGRLRDDHLHARVDDCERRIEALEQR
jgi:hypothetical protein